MKLSTRARSIILSLLITFIFILFQRVDFIKLLDIDASFDFVKLFVISLVMYLGVFWALSFRIKGERFVTVLFFPSLAIFVLTLYIELIIGSIFGDINRVLTQILASMIVALVSYILILTANILNVGFLENIPLTQAGRAAHYVLTLISTYLFFSIIFSNSIGIILKISLVFAVTYLFTTIALWTIKIEYRQRFLSSLSISITMVVLGFVLVLWPISSEYLALIMTLIYYMALGMALEIREVLSSRIWLEYLLLFFAIILILLLISDWGINGRLI